ncbi:protein pangolin, isoforms A/H/I/S isoform X2 [Teleopsis dalmanni]|uniref:protein pangolin, isoforms A/H/I/S isoform X2 n=1 Tax=Teleopsis dalmanni TaxID=139649 RepID=UPI0018CF67DF|nr:protein pangolin, isoforms A/H/I/S isoform X2 [Teleopsis dalmanni]
MPHNSHSSHSRHGGSSSDDLGSTDEVKVFKDEGDREDEKISSENLLVEEKSSLIDLTESEEKSSKITARPDHSPVFGKLEPHSTNFSMGYLVSPYSYSNGGAGGLPVTMANKIGLPPFFCHNGDPLTTPPPAHCGIPPYQLDPKAMGLTRPAIYPFSSSQYPYPILSPDMSQVASWHTPSVYSAASTFRNPYPSSLPINTTIPSDFPFRFSPSLMPSVHSSPHHVLNSHPAVVTPGPKQDCGQDSTTNHRFSRNLDTKNSTNSQSNECKDSSDDKKKPHIKKPLNAFMLYMKEMRAKVVAECTLKESAAINQILGRRWHALGREEQAKYYELARRERQLHMQMYPDWSSRTNASRGKKRKRKQEINDGGNNMKKCRARFGLDQQNQWCKPCRRKKKCIRYMEVANSYTDKDEQFNGSEDMDGHISDDDDENDNIGSCDSIDDSKTVDEDSESLNQSLSSPGCLSGLSSLQSPSTSLASPLNLLNSPAAPTASLLLPNNDQQPPQQVSLHNLNQNIGTQQTISHQHQNPQQTQQKPSSSNHKQNTATTSATSEKYETSSTSTPALMSLLPTHSTTSSTSSIASSSGLGTGSSNSSTSSPASFSDRMMRSLLSSSPAMLLGNRFSHLAMGINSNEHHTPHHLSAGLATVVNNNGYTVDSNSVKSAHDVLVDSLPYNNPLLPNDASMKDLVSISTVLPSVNKLTNTGIIPLPVTCTSIPSPVNFSPADLLFEKSIPHHRSPIGANPRDINNPLSINQLTKRGDNNYNNYSNNQSDVNVINSSSNSSFLANPCSTLAANTNTKCTTEENTTIARPIAATATPTISSISDLGANERMQQRSPLRQDTTSSLHLRLQQEYNSHVHNHNYIPHAIFKNNFSHFSHRLVSVSGETTTNTNQSSAITQTNNNTHLVENSALAVLENSNSSQSSNVNNKNNGRSGDGSGSGIIINNISSSSEAQESSKQDATSSSKENGAISVI